MPAHAMVAVRSVVKAASAIVGRCWGLWCAFQNHSLVRLAIQAAVDGPLRRTLELLTRAETTPPEQRDAAW
jgi:hypothetical protein